MGAEFSSGGAGRAKLHLLQTRDSARIVAFLSSPSKLLQGARRQISSARGPKGSLETADVVSGAEATRGFRCWSLGEEDRRELGRRRRYARWWSGEGGEGAIVVGGLRR
ncbi:hypothetical protein QR680_005126 [Steinernema hermaphroditum]|uniref:Uncharacterized protein n=1 Tax=Steinernema hermaphroditum TaxID=289476 RepID=A0AA39HSB4_9BILA|nr:hypothetical protein QR680_005126 [Steinernema hermaphroditum]